MTFNAPSFFAGVGTVLVLLGAGFGGGVLMSGVLSDSTPREPNRVERRAAETAPPVITTKPVPVAPAPDVQMATPSPSSEPQPGGTANASVVRTEAQTQPQAAPAQPPVPVPSAAAPTPALGPQQPVALINPNQAEEERSAAQAKAQEAKRLAAEKRKAERRKQTAERRRQEQTREAEQRAPAGRSSPEDAADDVRIERPFFMRRERDFGGPPIFRFFGNED